MNVVVALMLAVGVLLITTAGPSADLSEKVGRYLRPEPRHSEPDESTIDGRPAADAGLGWSRSELLLLR
jgi:hypothetical protein